MPATDMAEGAAFALYSCMRRYIMRHLLWTTPCRTRSQPARYPRRAARRRQRGARRAPAAAEPLGDEPGAGAPARDDRRSAAGQGRARPRADAARARTARARRPGACRMREAVLRPAEKLDLGSSSAPSRCGPAKGSSRPSGPRSSRASAPRRPACGCASCPSRTRTAAALRDGTVDLETGVVGPTTGPEVRAQALFRDRFIGVVRQGHALCRGEMTPAALCRRPAVHRVAARARRGTDR